MEKNEKDKTTKKWLKCSRCKRRKPDVKLRVDPYMLEIYNETLERNYCDDCYHENLMDI